jgi:glycosyltransferase involved in cell wall biosynthesis
VPEQARRCLLAFEPPDGGVAENVRQLALGLRAHGWRPHVLGPPDALCYPELEVAGIPIASARFSRGYRHPLRDLGALVALVRTLHSGRFDIVHAHSAKAGVLGRIAAAVTGTPVIYSPHCFPFVGPWRAPRRIFSVGVERALARVSDAIICVAEQERRLALELGVAPAERLVLIHNGSPPCAADRVEPDPELARFAAGAPLAACIAVLRAQKAVHVFVEAAPKILARVPDARLAIIGDGPLRPQLEELARGLGVGDRLRFLPFRPPSSRQLASIDVFVLPSAWEALPIALLEALACGVPQVATDVGGCREAVGDGDTGLLCPPHDADGLARAVVELLEAPERRARMADASRRRHAEHFHVDAMIARTAALYDLVARGSALSSPPRRRP